VAFECARIVPLESQTQPTVRLAPPTPVWFTSSWSWDAADDFSTVPALRSVWRSGCLGIDRFLLGLTLDSVTRPERTFEAFRETSLTATCRHVLAINPLFGSTSEHSSIESLSSR
jgi:hypothetical protein